MMNKVLLTIAVALIAALGTNTVIAVPAEVKHWHGAARDSWFQHLTYHTHVGANASNEWLEPVPDTTYDTLK